MHACMLLGINKAPKLHLLDMLSTHKDETIRIIETVAAEWKDLAKTLGFNDSRIKIIDKDCRESEEACREMFTRWLRREHDLQPPTWHSLIQCLERTNKSNFTCLAFELKRAILLHSY